MKTYQIQIYEEYGKDIQTVWTFTSPPAKNARAAVYKIWKNMKGLELK